MAIEVVVEHAEQRLEHQPWQAVISAGNVRAQIAGFLQQDRGCERQHQQRKAAIAQQEPARGEADKAGRNRGREQPADRLAPAQACGGKANRIGADAEEGGMTERDDAGIAEDKVEREREHHHHQHLAAESHPLRKHEIDGDGDKPRQSFREAETMALEQIFRRALTRFGTTCRGYGLTRGHRTPPA